MNAEHLLKELALAQGQARTDRLTGLGNLLALDEVLGRCLREEQGFALVLFDMAHFKAANFALGYEGANDVLRQVGRVLREGRGDGYAFRQGGDEFLVVLPGGREADAACVRDRVEAAAGTVPLPGGDECYIAGGVALWEPGTRLRDAMERAQRRMEQRKQSLAGTAT